MDLPVVVIPHLICRNAASAIEFYQKAFNAIPVNIMDMADGSIMHAQIKIGGSPIYLVDENPNWHNLSPLSLGGTPVTIHLQVSNVDTMFNQALAAGCTVKMPLGDQFWGDRYGSLLDPFGHSWAMAQTVKHLTPDELKIATAEFFAKMRG